MTSRIRIGTILAAAVLTVLTAPVQSWAEMTDPAEILREAEDRHSADTAVSEISMVVYPDLHNKDDFRQMRIMSYGRGTTDSYMEFITPRAIKGLRMLSLDQDQWIFFPSTGRVRKIAAKSKSSSVKGVGGDFSYEDFSGGSMEEKYNLQLVGNNPENWIIEGIAKNEDSAYDRILVTVEKERVMMMKVEYYTEEDGHLKDLVIQKVGYLGGREVPIQMVMVNRKKESMTVIITHSAEYDVLIDDRYFNPTRFYR